MKEFNWKRLRRAFQKDQEAHLNKHQQVQEARRKRREEEAAARKAAEQILDQRLTLLKDTAPDILRKINRELFEGRGKVARWKRRERKWTKEGWSGGWRHGSPTSIDYIDKELVLGFTLKTPVRGLFRRLEVVRLLERSERRVDGTTVPATPDLDECLKITVPNKLDTYFDLLDPKTANDTLLDFTQTIIDLSTAMYLDE